MANFNKFDIVVGNRNASRYVYTCVGAKCIVTGTEVEEQGYIAVRALSSPENYGFEDFEVDPECFNLVVAKSDARYYENESVNKFALMYLSDSGDEKASELLSALLEREEEERLAREEAERIAVEKRLEAARLARQKAEEERKRKLLEKESIVKNLISDSERNYLIDNMCDLLGRFGYQYRISSLNKIIDEWAYNKRDIISHIRKHPNYLEGKFMIAFSHDFDREIDFGAGGRFYDWICDHYNDWTYEERCCVSELLRFNRSKDVTINVAAYINLRMPGAHVHEGEKLTRAVNKVCKAIGIDKIKIMETNPATGRQRDVGYNRQFAIFSDCMSPLQIVRHTVLSVSPLDYLTMSFGNSWASCHTIDKANIRNSSGTTYEGMYSSGTVSYMLDKVSMVLYTVDGSYYGNEYWNEDKIIRQMFHWGEEKLIQGRLYPQSNDGYRDAYKPYREIVQKLISEVYDFPNRWVVSKNIREAVRTEGTHYKDYECYSDCTISKIRDNENDITFTIGHDPICIYCGQEHSEEESIDCCHEFAAYRCSECGAPINEDDVRWVNGEPYCEECTSYCERCNEYYINDECDTEVHMRTRWGRATECWCDGCVESYAVYCEICDEYHDGDDVSYVESENAYVCDCCFIDQFSTCEDCGEAFRDYNMSYDAEGTCRCRDCGSRFETEPARIAI